MGTIDPVTFLRKIQRILEEGDFVATYKFALLHALADLSVEHEVGSEQSLTLGLDEIAEKYLQYYWRQARPFRHGRMLLQNTGRQAAVLTRVSEAHASYGISLHAVRRDPAVWGKLVSNVADTIEKMPLWRLQLVGDQADEFLYRRDRFLHRRVTLEPGVAGCFRSFHSFIVNMVRGAWVVQLTRIQSNQDLLGEHGDLSEFLFGGERRPLNSYREILRQVQNSRCFYCGREVRGEGALDHFIPWSRYPADLGHNFVFTDNRCNTAKRDHLAAPEHLAHWTEQNLQKASELETLFEDAVLRHDIDRTRTITIWAYEQAELSKSRVWLREKAFCELDTEWRQALTPDPR